jgi:serine/threonine protein phosphatase PrpC
MPVDIGLLLQNVQVALLNQQYQHAHFLLDYAIKLSRNCSDSPSLSPHDVGIGLHRGNVRQDNEDCVLALQGTLSRTQEDFGLFIVCDGMGGHAYGQEAAHLALRTILEYLFPFFINHNVLSNWKLILANSIRQANHVIYAQNQLIQHLSAIQEVPVRDRTTSQMSMMGTTITAVLLLGTAAYIANVGDSRTYLYSMEGGLRRLTKDHSVVAELLANGALTEEEIYTHRQRNQITRALGTGTSVEVDMFVAPLQQDAILLLCSDGLWEMTRDYKIENILSSPGANAASMANQLVQLANSGGGRDNIGGIVIQMQQVTESHKVVTDVLNPIGTPT